MIPAVLIAELFREIQENALPALWSQGVTLTRGASVFMASKLSPEECVIHIRTPGHPINPKVTLWPKDLDWDCDCGNEESPCPHVAASVILLKRGDLKTSTDPLVDVSTTSLDLSKLHYIFSDSPEGLRLERFIVNAQGKKKLETPLINYKSGIAAGRIKSPDVIASKEDFTIDQILKIYNGRGLDRNRLEALFRSFESDQNVFLDSQPITISSWRILPQYECFDEADGFRLKRVDNSSIEKKFRHGVALCRDAQGIANTLRLMNSTQLLPEEQKLTEGEGSFWSSSQEKVLFGEVLPRLNKKISITVNSLRRPQTLEVLPHIDLRLEKDQTTNGETCLSVLANVVYGEPPIVQLNYATLELDPVQNSRSQRLAQVVQRNKDMERQLMQKLSRELNLQPNRRVQFQGQEAINFVKGVQAWDYTGDGARLFQPEVRQLEAKIEVKESNGYSFQVNFIEGGSTGHSGDATASFESVFKAWQQGEDSVPLLNGSWAKLPKDWMQRYGRKIQEFLAANAAGKEIAPQRLPELSQLCEDVGTPYPDSLKKLRNLLQDFQSIQDSKLPADLTAQLRPYQKKGVNWLCFLRDAGLGAMLADDMGLGKTLQALCALEGKTLIVAPTSVIFNWAQELKKFRPSLKVSLYYGNKRELDETSDVVLTSYGLLRIDQEKLNTIEWDNLVLDEAQIIKNPESLVAKAAHSLKGKFRVTLSGTPVENRLDDLWSQFEFINPGLLGRRQEFIEKYARPIGLGDMEAAQRLKARIKPFILRRLKREVAPELPPRTETVLHCELSSEERNTYETLLASTRKEVLQTLESGGGNVLKALEVILRLRQACCHRGLIPGILNSDDSNSSSKVDLLMETLEESLSEGHKSLIFSQWTSFLDKIAIELKSRNISYSRIDGSTRNRQEVVDEFQGRGPQEGPPVMLISLKAGGVGLTLTAADHVFITDPWWNPSVEDQAADRAHRIGQQNPVMIHRLVAKETIEERILVLQESKKDLAKAVLDEGGAALSLTRDDIMNLLR